MEQDTILLWLKDIIKIFPFEILCTDQSFASRSIIRLVRIFNIVSLGVSSAHQGCIYLLENAVKTVKLCNIITIQNKCFLLEYLLKCNLFPWSNLNFSIITPVFSSFRNHSNMLIYHSRNISPYYKCWKQLSCFLFSGFSDEQKVKKNSIYLKQKLFITL